MISTKRALVAVLLTAGIWASAHAQLGTTGAGKVIPGGAAPTFTGAGDVVSGASSWYGLRAYNAAYATANGKLINVVRASDSQACDILAATTGGLGVTASCTGGANGTAAATFCNATTCAIATAYDQSGANLCTSAPCNATQATAAARPTLVFNCIGSLPCMQANSANSQALATSGSSAVSQPFTVAGAGNRTGNTTAFSGFLDSGDGTFWGSSANTFGGFFGTIVTATAADNTNHALVFMVNGASSIISVDNTETSVSPGAGALSAGYNLFGQSTQFTTGNIYEAGVWPSGFTGTQRTNMCHNIFTYWGTVTSC